MKKPKILSKIKFKKKQEDVSAVLFQRNAGEKLLYFIAGLILTIWCISLLYPYTWLLINSLEDAVKYAINMSQDKIFTFPETLKFENYINAFRLISWNNTGFIGMFWNSVWLSFTISIVGVFFPACTGYVFAKYNFKGKRIIYFLAIMSMTLPVVGNSAANMKLKLFLGLYDTPIARIIAGTAGFGSDFLIMLSIFEGISWTYAEAVFIDGGNDFTVFFRIMLPQAVPAMLTLLVTAVIANWKQYENILMYYPSYPTLMTGLYLIKNETYKWGEPVYYAGLVISTIPIVLLYAFSSSAMMKNLSVGGIKG